uniref:DUF7045 domain-containing protein n=1 Tax=Romanomermis culicivorax TaxID=13658 RepID=A0A915HF98_ROMCU
MRSTLAPENTNGSYCNQEKIYKSTKWTIMNPKIPNHIFVPCGYLGDFATHDRLSFKLPKNHLYCTNVTFDCFDSTKFTMNQYSCSTNQIVSGINTKSDFWRNKINIESITNFAEFKYRCLASWSDNGDKFTYVLEESKLVKECIVSRNFSSNGTNLILLIFTGRHCEREALDRKSCSRYFENNRYEFAYDLKQVNSALFFCYAYHMQKIKIADQSESGMLRD